MKKFQLKGEYSFMQAKPFFLVFRQNMTNEDSLSRDHVTEMMK